MKTKYIAMLGCAVFVLTIVVIAGPAAVGIYAVNNLLPNTGGTGTTASTPSTGASVAGTGPAIAGSGHIWKTTIATSFGGSTECQNVAGKYPDTCTMNKNGPYYFATGWPANPNVPDSLREKVFPLGSKLIFKRGINTVIAVFADRGPGATGDGRYLDLGQNTADYLGLPGKGPIEWDFIISTDKLGN